MAIITISNSGGNWNSTGTWVGGVIPTSTDDVVCSATSGALTVNVTSAQCKTIDFTNYTNTFTISASQILTVSNNVKFFPTMSVSGTGTITLNSTATLFSAGIVWTGNLTFGGTSATYTLVDSWVINGNVTLSGVTSQTMNGFSITIGGSLTNIVAVSTNGTTTFTMNGTGTLNCSSTGTISQNLTINTSGTITINSFKIGGSATFTYTSGTTTGTLILNPRASCSLNCSGMTWNQFDISYVSAGTVNLLSNLNVATSMLWSLNSGVIATINNNNINFSGTSFQIGSLTSNTFTGSANIICFGSVTITVPSTSTVLGLPIVFNCTSNTVTLPANGNLTHTKSITFNSLGSLVTTNNILRLGTSSSLINNITGLTFNNITLAGTSSFDGSQGFTTSILSASSIGFTTTLKVPNVYLVKDAITLVATAAGPIILVSSNVGLFPFLTLENNPNSTQILEHVWANSIDSSLGKTMWSYKGTLTGNKNWISLTSVTRNPNLSSNT